MIIYALLFFLGDTMVNGDLVPVVGIPGIKGQKGFAGAQGDRGFPGKCYKIVVYTRHLQCFSIKKMTTTTELVHSVSTLFSSR